MNFPLAIADWERAYAAHRDAGDHVGAVRVARTLAYMNGSRRRLGGMSGWLARAQTLLGDRPSRPKAGGWR